MDTIMLIAPLLLLPVHLTTTTDQLPRFLWNGRFDATGYVLELRHQETDTTLRVISGFSITETDPQTSICPLVEWRPEKPLDLGTWSWRVACTGAGGAQSPWAMGRNFTIATEDLDAISFQPDLKHPYLHIWPDRITQLKQLIATDDHAARGYRRLLAAAETLMDRPLPDESYAQGSDGQHQDYPLVGIMLWARVSTLGLAYLLTGDTRYADVIRADLLTAATFERWVGEKFIDPAQIDPIWHSTLETSMFTSGMALGYDWIYDQLTEAQRETIRQALIDKGIQPLVYAWADRETAGRIPRHQVPGGNWFAVCTGGAGEGALAVLNECPEAGNWVRMVRDNLRWWLRYEGGEYMVDQYLAGDRPRPVIGPDDPNFDADGGYRESVGYMTFAMQYLGRFADALALISDEDLARHYPSNLLDPIAATIYQRNEQGRDIDWLMNFGDSGGNAAHSLLYAHLVRSASSPLGEIARALQDRVLGEIPMDPWSLLWFTADRPRAPLGGVRAGKLFGGIGVATFRTGSSRRGAHAALKTRQNRGHHDIGAMYFYSGGETWITDSGVYDYTSPIYGEFLCRTKAQNLVLVDGADQIKTDGTLEVFIAGLDYGYARCQAGNTCPDRLNSWLRELLLIGPDTCVVIDRLQGQGPHRYDWLLHPAVPWQLTATGVELLGQRENLHVHMMAPEHWQAEVRPGYEANVPRSYLALSPVEKRQNETFLVVMAPTTGEAGPVRVTRLNDGATGPVVRIIRPDLDILVACAEQGSSTQLEDCSSDASLVVHAVEPRTRQLRLCALHQGSRLQLNSGRTIVQAARKLDCSLEVRETGLLYTLDIPGQDSCEVSLARFDCGAGVLDSQPVVMDVSAGDTQTLTLAPGRHELILATSADLVETVTQRPDDIPLVRTRHHAPVFEGVGVRVSDTLGWDGVSMIDGSDETAWHTRKGGVLPQWCELVLPATRELSRVSVCPLWCQSMAINVRQSAEQDWQSVGLIEGAPAGRRVEFEFTPRPVQAIRIEIARTSSPGNVCGLYEVAWR